MRPYISLYIDNQEVEFQEPPTILFTYAHTDLHNPTVVKNSFSKTLTVDGTPKNNRIFGCFGEMTRITEYGDGDYTGAYFNPSRKVDFILLRNGEPIERGYVKLDRVVKKGNQLQYDITLYGGLGQMLYALTYGEDGEQLKLSSLEYDFDMDMDINRNVVKGAWQHITGMKEVDDVYDKINFAPCYNGIPENFSADKVAIDVESFESDDNLYNSFIKSKDGYTTKDGWLIGELNNEYTEWQVGDLRSYLQRPVIRFKEIVNACCNPKNNGGYEVDLDPDFFNENNPYWQDAWMTLPMVKEMLDEGEGVSATINGNILTIPTTVGGNISLSVDFNLVASVDSDKSKLYTGVFAMYQGNVNPQAQYNRAFEVKMEVYKADGTKVTESPKYIFYSNVKNTNGFDFTNANVVEGSFLRHTDGYYYFNNTSYNLLTPTFTYESGMYGKFVVSTQVIHNYGGISGDVLFTGTDGNSVSVSSTTTTTFFNEEIRFSGDLGYRVSKKTLLNSENTPCDYFLNYLKMFNLHIWSDNIDKRVYVRLRKNYFTGDKVDLDSQVDRGDSINITPIMFDAKYYVFNNEIEDTYLSKTYKDAYGFDYGIQKINTNYNFDNSSKDLIEHNVFKGCITERGRSKYYVSLRYLEANSAFDVPSFYLDGFKTYLFNGNGDTTEGSVITPKNADESRFWWNKKYYDFMPKPNFIDKDNKGVDGANVLLFYGGKQLMKDADGKLLNFSISDDIPQFTNLNDGEPCWIWTYDPSIVTNTTIGGSPHYGNGYIPMFSRYLVNENNHITHSWDFGTPRELYVDNWNIDEYSSIYTQYWKTYMNDELDVDTREVECSVWFKAKVNPDMLQTFVYFDKCYWLIKEITDYDCTSQRPTKVKLVKINDINNYMV